MDSLSASPSEDVTMCPLIRKEVIKENSLYGKVATLCCFSVIVTVIPSSRTCAL